jgi:predicted secreted protein
VNITTAIFTYLIIWWTALFAILPLGVRSHWEEGTKTPGGGDPSAPVDPKLKRKFITTTWVAAILFAVVWLVWNFHLVSLPQIPGAA